MRIPRSDVRKPLVALFASIALAAATQLALITPVVGDDGAGGVALTTADPAGTTLVGGCFELYTDAGGGTRGKLVPESGLCDAASSLVNTSRGTPDGASDGSLGWAGLAAGGYVVHQTLAAARPGTAGRYELGPDTAVTVSAGGVTRLDLVFRPVTGLTLHKVDAAGKPLAGACFSLRGTDGRIAAAACDSAAGASDTLPAGDGRADGLLVFPGLTPTGGATTYTLRELHAPDGYAAVPDQQVVIDPTAAPRELTITDSTGGGGGLALTFADPAASTLVGGCFELYADAGGGTRGKLIEASGRCDAATSPSTTRGAPDGATNGSLGWTGLEPAGYVIHQTLGVALAGTGGRYELAADTAVTVGADGVTLLALVFRPVDGLTVHKVDAAGRPLPGACFSLTGADGRSGGAACDGIAAAGTSLPAGDGRADGVLVFPGLTPTGGRTTYTLREVQAPGGYSPAADQSVTIDPTGTPAELTITDTTGSGGGLAIAATDPAGATLVGACFELYTDAGGGTRGKLVEASGLCDQATVRDASRGMADGATDGSLGWAGLAPGSYVVHQTLGAALASAPNQYELAPDTTVVVVAGEVAHLDLVFRLVSGLTIHKVDAGGKPLLGACFAIKSADGRIGGTACDGTNPASAILPAGDGAADGLLQFGALIPDGQAHTFTLSEIRAPAGYAPVEQYHVEIAPGRVTEASIVNTPGAPAAISVGGGGGGGAPIIGLELAIDSTIDISTFMGQPTQKGATSASGTITLVGDPTTGWNGVGNLASTTDLKATLSCQTTTVTGSGTYDWVVRNVHAGPDIAADGITVDMDSGPITENPDAVVQDACGQTLDSTMNTWENLFFQAYGTTHYKSAGFRVDGWKAVGGPAVWTAGGEIAETTFTGTCSSPLIVACKDETTFKLNAVVTGTASAPAPGATAAAPEAVPLITPLPLDGGAAGPIATLPPGAPSGGLPAGCTDFQSCFGQDAIFVIVGALALLGGGFLLYQRISSGSTPVMTGTFDAQKIAPIDEKIAPIGNMSLLTDAQKIAPIDQKFAPVGTVDALATESPIEPGAGALPPPPGSSVA